MKKIINNNLELERFSYDNADAFNDKFENKLKFINPELICNKCLRGEIMTVRKMFEWKEMFSAFRLKLAAYRYSELMSEYLKREGSSLNPLPHITVTIQLDKNLITKLKFDKIYQRTYKSIMEFIKTEFDLKLLYCQDCRNRIEFLLCNVFNGVESKTGSSYMVNIEYERNKIVKGFIYELKKDKNKFLIKLCKPIPSLTYKSEMIRYRYLTPQELVTSITNFSIKSRFLNFDIK
jgi:hypothetical protein